MSTHIEVAVHYEFAVRAAAKEVFALLADVPASASHYPQLDRLVDLGDNAYRWEMHKIGIGQYSLQTVYAARYTSNAAKGTVQWTPVEGVGNAQVAGSWTIRKKKDRTELALEIQLAVALPVAPLMKMVVTPLLQAEFERLTETYIDRLIAHWGGEV